MTQGCSICTRTAADAPITVAGDVITRQETLSGPNSPLSRG